MPLKELTGNKRKKIKRLIEYKEDIEELKDIPQGMINAIIFVENTGMYGERLIDRNLLPDGVVERKEKGHPVVLLGLDESGLWPIVEDDDDTPDSSPLDCYGALPWDELNELLRFIDSLGEKIKLGIFFGLAFCLLITFFLIGTIAMGGGHV